MNGLPDNLKQPLVTLLLALADDKLMLGHRNSDWTGLGPILEEDIAFSHMAQDEMAHAQAIYEFISAMIGTPGGADELAFGRKPEEYRCAHIVEVPDEFDWATAMARKFYCDHFDLLRLQRLSQSTLKQLADLSRRIADEEQLHVTHVDGWIKRLGRGGKEAHQRLQRALNALAPIAPGLFEEVQCQSQLQSEHLFPAAASELYSEWRDALSRTVASADLKLELPTALASSHASTSGRGGRGGMHTPHLKELLNEMCEVYRMEPGAAW